MEKVREHFTKAESKGLSKIYPTWPGVKVTFKEYAESVCGYHPDGIKQYFIPGVKLLNHDELSKVYSLYCRDMKELLISSKKDEYLRDILNGKTMWNIEVTL